MSPLTAEERKQAFTNAKKEEVIRKQRLPVRYHVEDFEVAERPRRFLEAFAAILKHTNYRLALDHYMRVTARCARCSTSCQIFMATGDARDIPCYRSELLLSVYRRHFTISGILRGRILGDPGLTDAKVQEMADAFYNCNACRRCTFECPMGIDHALITHLGRYILSELGIVPRNLAVSVREQLTGKSGNTSAVPVPALKDSLEFLSEEMQEDKQVEIEFPIDQEDAEYLFLPAVSDFLMEADTLMGIAAVFRATGDSWTVGTGYYDAINYGLFYSDHVMEHVVAKVMAEARRLKIRKILIGECGHASRTAKAFYPAFRDGQGKSYPILNIVEYTCQAWKNGRLKLREGAFNEPVTYHDPCNLARTGWIVDQPRELLKAVCKNYVPMTPDGRSNICCGGGGGLVAIDELKPYRMIVSGRAKADQIRATGARYCVAPCANCKKQLRELVEHYHIDCQILGFHDLLYKVIAFA
jgi:Fe-S oxidoreductase